MPCTTESNFSSFAILTAMSTFEYDFPVLPCKISNVEAGGATVFTYAEAAVKPSKVLRILTFQLTFIILNKL